jgi:hypothetical protein
MKRWCIINLRGLHDAELHDNAPLGQEVLSRNYAPHRFYDDRDIAELEMIRLAKKYCNQAFTLFEAVASVNESANYIKRQAIMHIDPIEP